MNTFEKEFNTFVLEFGGVLVSQLVGSSPDFDNADYLFDEYGIVAELKTLDEDKLVDPRFIDKTSRLYREAFQQGGTQTLVFGTVRLPSTAFTPEYQEQLIKFYEQPVRNAVKRANKQIRQTKERLRKDNYGGVLLLVNENNRALDPLHVVQLLDRILARPHYSSINNAIFFTSNLRATHPSQGGDFMSWVPVCRRREGIERFEEFELALRKSWYAALAKKYGSFPLITVNDDFFGSLQNKPKQHDAR